MANDKDKDGLLGTVYSVRTESQEITSHLPNQSAEPECSHLITYDTEGRKTSEEWRHRDGSPYRKRVFLYDGFGNLIEEASCVGDGSLSRRTEYAYDACHRRTRESRYTDAGSLALERTYTYQANGKMSEETLVFDQAEGFSRVPSYKVEGLSRGFPLREARSIRASYETGKKPLQVSFYQADGSFAARILFTYDSEGRLNRFVQYDGQLFPDQDLMTVAETGMLFLTKTFLFLKNAYHYSASRKFLDLARSVAYGIPLLEINFEYDREGRKSAEYLYFASFLQFKKTYSYDDRGSRIEKAEYSATGSLLQRARYSYEFDEHGNWVKKTVSDDLKSGEQHFLPKKMLERTITYY